MFIGPSLGAACNTTSGAPALGLGTQQPVHSQVPRACS
jgi:hypothetical protein